MLPFFTHNFGNPATPHEFFGGIATRAVARAREAVSTLINCRDNELLWTSGATESNNLAILGFASNVPSDKRHLITQLTEHSSVLEPCRHLETQGWNVSYLPVDRGGRISVEQLKDTIRKETSLVTVMYGNNEIGTLQPVHEIATVCAARGIPFHCDAAQAAGKIPIDVQSVRVSMLTLSAHKMYGPKGVGALFVRDLNKFRILTPRVLGGGQEKGLRAGTLNVPCIVGMGAAASLLSENMQTWPRYIQRIRDRFESSILDAVVDVSINGTREYRLPHISNIAFHGTDNDGLLTMLPGLVASTGSACHVADFAQSNVLSALGTDLDRAHCSLRFGFGKDNTDDEVRTAVDIIADAVTRLRCE